MKPVKPEEDDKIVAFCSGCGDEVVEGEPHDCPVLGTIVTVERVR